MYEWLDDELKRVRWSTFHDLRPCEAADELDARLPPSYLAFVRRFGAAKLYLRDGHYQLGVFCPPEAAVAGDQEISIIGYVGSNDAAFKVEDLASGREARVYEVVDGVPEEVAFDFASWLDACASDAREEYSAEDWTRLERGPDPFTPEEEAIVVARKQFSWELVGGGTGRALRFRIRNDSGRTLPVMTLGVRHKNGGVEARLPVDVSSIAPGEEKLIDAPGYATLDPEDAVRVDLPEPTPATRDAYAELARNGPMKRPSSNEPNE